MENKVVSAVCNASGLFGFKSPNAVKVEEAMDAAILQAIAEGVSIENSDEILKRKLEARDKVLSELN